mmetsp:Transcript_4534/g.8706  ORF Transcript_4534/g.8706 Transcript_4534/m.8706 type:complete len:124 (+) Transcript_4534:145-516(+)
MARQLGDLRRLSRAVCVAESHCAWGRKDGDIECGFSGGKVSDLWDYRDDPIPCGLTQLALLTVLPIRHVLTQFTWTNTQLFCHLYLLVEKTHSQPSISITCPPSPGSLFDQNNNTTSISQRVK